MFVRVYLVSRWSGGIGTRGKVTRLVEVYKKGGMHFRPTTHRLGPVYLERPDRSNFQKNFFFFFFTETSNYV